MNAPRTTARRVEWLAERCSPRDVAILRTANRLRLVSGQQLERLHFVDLAGRSRAVTRWRVLKRLADWQLLAPLARRVGGSARGSAGAVYALDGMGVRVLRHLALDGQHGRIRRPATPGERKIKHTLAVAELYAGLVEGCRQHGFTVACFDVEPRYADGAGWLSPDAYAVMATVTVADHWWIEVDRATESAATLRRKFEAYAAYYEQGRWAPLGVMPRVLVAVPNERRRQQLAAELPAGAKKVVEIVLQDAAVGFMLHTLTHVDS